MKKAYSEMQNYILDFNRDSDCYNMKACWYTGNFEGLHNEFAEYLIEKKGFKPFVPYDIDRVPTSFMYRAFRGHKVVGGFAYRSNNTHPASFAMGVIPPSNAYMAVLSDDFYTYGVSGARVFLIVNNKRFGRQDARWESHVDKYPNDFPRAGKDLFMFHIQFDGKFVSEGSQSYRYWKDNDNCNPDNSETMNVSGIGCLGRIIEDGWQIKYKW